MKIICSRTIVRVVVILVLLQWMGGSVTATLVPREQLSTPEIDSCSIYTSDRILNLAQEDQCDRLEQARDEMAQEMDQLRDESRTLHQAWVDRQDELTARCSQDLSIIACTASAVETASLEYEDEINRVNAESDAAFERWLALNTAFHQCNSAERAGEPYEPEPAVGELISTPAPAPPIEEPQLDTDPLLDRDTDNESTSGVIQARIKHTEEAPPISPEQAAGGVVGAVVVYNVLNWARRVLESSRRGEANEHEQAELRQRTEELNRAKDGITGVQQAVEIGEVGETDRIAREMKRNITANILRGKQPALKNPTASIATDSGDLTKPLSKSAPKAGLNTVPMKGKYEPQLSKSTVTSPSLRGAAGAISKSQTLLWRISTPLKRIAGRAVAALNVLSIYTAYQMDGGRLGPHTIEAFTKLTMATGSAVLFTAGMAAILPVGLSAAVVIGLLAVAAAAGSHMGGEIGAKIGREFNESRPIP